MSHARRKTVDWLLRRIGHGTTAVSLATALLVVTAAELGGQQPYTVYGRVVSADSSPVAMVRLVVLGATGQAVTTANGGFRLRLTLGTWKVELRRLGFQPDTTEFQVPRDAAGEIVITRGVLSNRARCSTHCCRRARVSLMSLQRPLLSAAGLPAPLTPSPAHLCPFAPPRTTTRRTLTSGIAIPGTESNPAWTSNANSAVL